MAKDQKLLVQMIWAVLSVTFALSLLWSAWDMRPWR